MVQAQMIVMATDRNGTEQFYLGNFGMEALKLSTIPGINNRPNEYLESITLCNDNGYQKINDRREAKLKATKKRESPAKTSTKVTPTQKRKELKRSLAKDSSSSSSPSSSEDDKDNETDKEPDNNSDDNDNDDIDNDDNDNDDNNNDDNSDNGNDNDNDNDNDKGNNLCFMNEDDFDQEDNRIANV
jgi:hypothetical protein